MNVMRYCSGVALLLTALVAGAQDVAPPVADATPVAVDAYEYILDPVHSGISAHVSGFREDSEFVFKKEPTYAGDDVRRKAIRVGDDRSQYVGLAFDVAANRLYVDQNRNLDLTDDGPGFEHTETFGPGSSRFQNVFMRLTYGDITIPYAASIEFYDEYLFVMVNTAWRGEIELAGKQIEIGIIDNLNGAIGAGDYLEFDHERHRDARLPYGAPDLLYLPAWMRFEGQVYRVSGAFRVVDDATRLALSMTPVTEDLMPVSFEGPFVSRVLLATDEHGYGLLDWPDSEMRIPKGSYSLTRVDLLDSFCSRIYSRGPFNITENAHITAGGPLRQTIQVERIGSRLDLRYVLSGMNDVEYAPDRWYENPVEFDVYEGDRKLFSDQFEYG